MPHENASWKRAGHFLLLVPGPASRMHFTRHIILALNTVYMATYAFVVTMEIPILSFGKVQFF
jgi:hypothetical protein